MIEILPGHAFRNDRFTIPFEAILYFYKDAPSVDPKISRYMTVTLTSVCSSEDGTDNESIRLSYDEGLALEAAWLEWRAERYAGAQS